jgi:hypothetical protein
MNKQPITLVITSCSKTKLDHPAPARDFYLGRLFRLVRQYAEENHFDWRIISAEHGLVDPGQVVTPYDTTLRTAKDEARLRDIVLPALTKIWPAYGRVVVIMGKRYRRVIAPALDRHEPLLWSTEEPVQSPWFVPRQVIEIIEDARGSGGLYQRVKNLLVAERALQELARADPF